MKHIELDLMGHVHNALTYKFRWSWQVADALRDSLNPVGNFLDSCCDAIKSL
jgi:hypothetical protein